jgi:hypothetical protein
MNNNHKLLMIAAVVVLVGIIARYMYFPSDCIENNKKKMINTIIRQSARWSAAAEQDGSPVIALLHANYGAAYLWALKDIVSDTEIEESANIDILEFTKKITDIQDSATRKVSKECPQFAGGIDEYLLKLGGDM